MQLPAGPIEIRGLEATPKLKSFKLGVSCLSSPASCPSCSVPVDAGLLSPKPRTDCGFHRRAVPRDPAVHRPLQRRYAHSLAVLEWAH